MSSGESKNANKMLFRGYSIIRAFLTHVRINTLPFTTFLESLKNTITEFTSVLTDFFKELVARYLGEDNFVLFGQVFAPAVLLVYLSILIISNNGVIGLFRLSYIYNIILLVISFTLLHAANPFYLLFQVIVMILFMFSRGSDKSKNILNTIFTTGYSILLIFLVPKDVKIFVPLLISMVLFIGFPILIYTFYSVIMIVTCCDNSLQEKCEQKCDQDSYRSKICQYKKMYNCDLQNNWEKFSTEEMDPTGRLKYEDHLINYSEVGELDTIKRHDMWWVFVILLSIGTTLFGLIYKGNKMLRVVVFSGGFLFLYVSILVCIFGFCNDNPHLTFIRIRSFITRTFVTLLLFIIGQFNVPFLNFWLPEAINMVTSYPWYAFVPIILMILLIQVIALPTFIYISIRDTIATITEKTKEQFTFESAETGTKKEENEKKKPENEEEKKKKDIEKEKNLYYVACEQLDTSVANFFNSYQYEVRYWYYAELIYELMQVIFSYLATVVNERFFYCSFTTHIMWVLLMVILWPSFYPFQNIFIIIATTITIADDIMIILKTELDFGVAGKVWWQVLVMGLPLAAGFIQFLSGSLFESDKNTEQLLKDDSKRYQKLDNIKEKEFADRVKENYECFGLMLENKFLVKLRSWLLLIIMVGATFQCFIGLIIVTPTHPLNTFSQVILMIEFAVFFIFIFYHIYIPWRPQCECCGSKEQDDIPDKYLEFIYDNEIQGENFKNIPDQYLSTCCFCVTDDNCFTSNREVYNIDDGIMGSLQSFYENHCCLIQLCFELCEILCCCCC